MLSVAGTWWLNRTRQYEAVTIPAPHQIDPQADGFRALEFKLRTHTYTIYEKPTVDGHRLRMWEIDTPVGVAGQYEFTFDCKLEHASGYSPRYFLGVARNEEGRHVFRVLDNALTDRTEEITLECPHAHKKP